MEAALFGTDESSPRANFAGIFENFAMAAVNQLILLVPLKSRMNWPRHRRSRCVYLKEALKNSPAATASRHDFYTKAHPQQASNRSPQDRQA
ncbi:MAG: hypothetical protein EB036_09095 [Betaproteobacteria bacterium]|nr:hypothetical protein [Betaproteobacteria bacterium]